MKFSSKFKTVLAISSFSALTACSSLHNSGVLSADEASKQDIRPAFANALQQEDWLANEYRLYLNKEGYKAFAVAWDNQGMPFAAGFSDDKLSRTLAQSEALRLCEAYSAPYNGACVIEDEEATTRADLTTANYPSEVIAYRDVDHWEKYLAIKGNKAIAGNLSGVQGSATADSKAEAEQLALAKCREHTHFSIPDCHIIASE
jgi:hypothetical protein